ncbi:GNAT family N-acetyltransferase [Cellulomonas pakistanensis]|uniref:N-acetyltransferase n=1 Tax=Cellulomonas pakistanensis TaxID=992287 RepID=A0A919PB64_9CELL|nr:GNAT family N-acetyltransferase [Cellulomonas pakistanensis]GIG37341.1 N-acetyltransferase [Cellulomonas pakistanensis]
MTTHVSDRADEQRFEIADDDGTVLGVAEYQRRDGVVVFTHTEVDPRQEGHGIGSTLVREALDAVRAAGDRIEPRCPFVRAFVADHPEYADLVADPTR